MTRCADASIGMPLLLAALAAATCLPGSATAQEQGGPAPITAEEFRREIAKRDAVIIELERRVRELENRIAGQGGKPPLSPAGPIPRAADTSPPSAAQPKPNSPEPGQVEIDKLAAERALERSLVETGAILLPRGQVEISPGFSFQRAKAVDATMANVDGNTFVADRSLTLNRYQASLSIRDGLPWQSQLEVYVPYRAIGRRETTDVLGTIVSSNHRSGDGIGDVRIGIARTLLHGSIGRPGLIGRLTWDSDTGKRSDDVGSLGSGFNELEGSLTAIYRLDPLVFVGTAGYQYAFEKNDIRPGEEVLLSLGTSLAVSPEASLSLSLNQVHRNRLRIGGQPIDGSSQLASSITFGTSVIVAPRMLLQVTAGMGLTDDAPDYSLGVSLPFRF